MANDEVLRLRATVVSEEALANIRAIGREIGIVQSKGGRGAQQAATGWAQLGKTVRMVGGELAGAATGLTGIGAAGLGAAAGFGIVAAAGYKLVSGLGDLSKKIIDLSNNSKELGLSTQALKAFATEAQKAGIAPEAMMQGMSNFKRNTEDFSMRIGELRGQMVAMGAGPVLARINAATTQLDKMKEAYDFKEVLMESDPSGMKARRFFEMIGLGADAARLSWDEFAETMATKKPLTEEQIQAAKDYNKALIGMGENWDALTTRVGIKLFPAVGRELNDISKILEKLGELDDWVESWIGKGDPMARLSAGINRSLGLDKFDPFGWKAERKAKDEAEDKRRIDATAPGSAQRAKVEKEIRERKEREGVDVAPQSVVRIPQMSAADREKLFAEEEARAAAAKEKAERDKAIAERAARGVSDRQSSFTGPGGVTVTQGGPTLEEDTARVRAEAEMRRVGEEADRARKAAEEEERRRAASQRPAPPGMQSFPRMSPAELEKLLNGPAAGGDVTPEQFKNMGRQSGLNSNIKPVSFSDGFQPAGGGSDSDASRIIKIGVFDALVDFKSYIEAGGTGEGGGQSGFMRASLGGGGGSLGGGGASTGGSGSTGTLGDTSVGPYGGFGSNNSGGQSAPRPGPGGQGGGGTSGPSGVGGDYSGQNQPGGGGQQASRPGAGGQSGGPSGAKAPNGAPAGATSGTIPGKFSEQITGMMAAGMQPKNIQAWLKEKGVDVSVATCGQFMAAKVKEAGGTPPTGAAVASNWNTFGGKEGAGYSDDPNAINIAVKQGVRTGQTGAHVTAAIPIRDKDGKITGWSGVGVNQGKGRGSAAVAGRGDYGRDVLTAVPLTIGTGKGQYQIRHQIVKPPDGVQTAQPNGQAAPNQQVASADPNAAPNGSSIPRAGAGISGSTPEDEAIRATAASAGVTAPEWKAIADIESTRNAESNRGKRTQYKGLFQVNEEKVRRSGGKDIFNARDNANAAAQFSRENAAIFKKKMGREPTAAETYLMHQQGPGFYTKGTMTNIGGNLPPSLKGRNPAGITREEFEAGWSQEVNRRAAKFATGPGPAQAPANVAAAPSGKPVETASAQTGPPTNRIDAAVAPPAPSGQVNVTVNSNGTKAEANTKREGDLFQAPTVRQHRQMQRTEDGGETLSI